MTDERPTLPTLAELADRIPPVGIDAEHLVAAHLAHALTGLTLSGRRATPAVFAHILARTLGLMALHGVDPDEVVELLDEEATSGEEESEYFRFAELGPSPAHDTPASPEWSPS